MSKASRPSPPSRERDFAVVAGLSRSTVALSSPPARSMRSKLEIAVPSTVPEDEELMVVIFAEPLALRVSVPAPALNAVSDPPVAIVAVSLPAPRVTFSRF